MHPHSTESGLDEPGLALVGYRGTGKSTIGRLLAERLSRPFVDADVELEARIGMPIAKVFEEQGEWSFREMEESLLGELTARSGPVLATGGGCVLRASNRRALRRFGFVAWLTADPATLANRLRDDPAGRPALTDRGLVDEVAEVLQFRTPLYREVAHEVIDTEDQSPEVVADRVLEAYRGYCDALRVGMQPKAYSTFMTVGELIHRLEAFPAELPVFFSLDQVGGKVREARDLVMNLTEPEKGTTLPLDDQGREIPAGFVDSLVIYPQEIDRGDAVPKQEAQR